MGCEAAWMTTEMKECGGETCPFLGPRMLRLGREDGRITASKEGQGATSVLSDLIPVSPWKQHPKASVRPKLSKLPW